MLDRKIAFIRELDKLKSVLRVSRLVDGSREENSAEHSWHLALMVLVLADYADSDNLDLSKALKMALIHDVIEIDAGDTYAFDDQGLKDKVEREEKAAARLFYLLPEPLASELHALWNEFELGLTDEARYVRALDRLNPFLSHIYNKGIVWQERGMNRTMLMSRMGEILHLCPALWEFLNQQVQEAIDLGILDPE